MRSVENLTSRSIKPADNFLWHLGTLPNPSVIIKPDLLHTVLLGVLKHLLECVTKFLEHNKRLELFNQIWSSVPSYLDKTRPKRAYDQVSQWQGKEMRVMARWLHAVLVATLSDATSVHRAVFDNALRCTCALLKFHQYAHYDRHSDKTLHQMEHTLAEFHDSKHVFQSYRAGKLAQRATKAVKTTLLAQRDEELNDPRVTTTE